MPQIMDPRMLAQALRGFNPSPVVNAESIPATALARVRDTRLRNADDMSRFDTPAPASGAGNAAFTGLARGIDKYLSQQRGDRNLEDAYKQYEEAERAKAQEQAKAKQQEAMAARAMQLEDEQRNRMQSREDQQWKWANKPPEQLTPQDLLQMQATQAQIANIMSQMEGRETDNSIKQEKAQREAAEAESMAGQKEQTNTMLVDSIDYLLDPAQAESMERATGSVDSMMPTFRQGTKDWENRFAFVQNALTADKLDMMTGVLSESDIAILKSIAAGGVDLSSSEPAIRNALTNFRSVLGGGEPAPSSGGVPEGVDPEDWAAMTPQEKALWQ